MKKFLASAVVIFGLTGMGLYGQTNTSANTVKGYVITLKGDTVRGDIKINPKKEAEPYVKVSVKNEKGEAKSFKAEKAKLYVAENITYVAKKFNDETFFFKVISTGAITLYELHYEEFSVANANEAVVKTDYFMEKSDGGELVKIKSGKFRKQVSDVMQDNEVIVQDINEKKYTYDNLQELFEEYNKQAKVTSKG